MSWPLVTLAEVAAINPRVPKGRELPETVAFLPMAVVSEQGEVTDPELRALAEVRKGFTYFERGDVLLAKITPCFENGKAAFLEDLPTDVGFGSTEFHVIRPNTELLDGKFLFYLVWNAKFRHEGERNMTGSAGQRRVPTGFLERYTFPLPPLETQKNIARVLEQADQLRKQAQQMESELNQLAQSLFLEMFGDPLSNTKGLHISAITDCFDIKTGKLDSNAAVIGGKYPFFTCAREDFWIDEYAFDQKAILLAGNNASADYSVKYFDGKFNAYQRTYVFSLKNDEWSYQYFKAALEFQLSNLKTSSKGTNTKYLTMEIFRRILLQVPVVKKQREFEVRMQKINLEKSKTQSLYQRIDELFESLMQRAFKGELTAPGSKAA